MIDLRSPNDMLDHYVERYDHLLPAPSAQLNYDGRITTSQSKQRYAC